MITHHVKEAYQKENENFSLWSSFVYIIAIITVILASIFIVTIFIRGIYGTQQLQAFLIDISVQDIPSDRIYHLRVDPVQNIIIDTDKKKRHN